MTDRHPRIAVLSEATELVQHVTSQITEAHVDHVADVEDLFDRPDVYDVLVAGPVVGTQRGLGILAAYHEHAPRTSIVLAFERPHVHTREIVWVGADALVEPDAPEVIGVAVRRSLDLVAGRTAVAEATDPTVQPLGRVLTVCSATGGCGKTFYATNLAHFLARWTGKRVALIDLDLQFGEVTAALRLKVKHTITDALAAEEAPDDGIAAHLDELMTPHDSGVEVLAAPRRPGEADAVTPAEIGRVIDTIRASYDYVVVDTPTGLGEGVLAAMDRSEQLYVMATLDLPSVRNLRLFVETLGRLEIPDEDVSLVLNKAQRGTGIEAEEVERVFGRSFHSILPYSPEVPKAVNQGRTVIDVAPGADVSRLLSEGLVDLLDDEDRHRLVAELGPTDGPSFGDRIKRLFRRSADDLSPAQPVIPQGADA